MSFFENTRKPAGLGGKIMVVMMNIGHSFVARWGLRFLRLSPDAKVLDCGCGGGANIKRMLKKCPRHGIVKTVLIIRPSVWKNQKKSIKKPLPRGAVKFCTAVWRIRYLLITVSTTVTAFETVYFWQDLPQCFREVWRVLKPGRDIFYLQRKQRRYG